MVEADIKAETALDHWSQFLRCTICFSFLREPHTLVCGHTFCKKCLKRLAEIAKEDSPEIRLRRLSLPCPTCRHPFPAKPSLTGKARTSIVLKHMVELWAKECALLLSSAVIKVRSVSTQTRPDCAKTRLVLTKVEPDGRLTRSVGKRSGSDRTQAGPDYLQLSKVDSGRTVPEDVHVGPGDIQGNSTSKRTVSDEPQTTLDREWTAPDKGHTTSDGKKVNPVGVHTGPDGSQTWPVGERVGTPDGSQMTSDDTQLGPDELKAGQDEEGWEDSPGGEETERQEVVFAERIRPLDHYLEAIMKRVLEFSEDMEQDAIENNKASTTSARTSNTADDPAIAATTTTTTNPATAAITTTTTNTTTTTTPAAANISNDSNFSGSETDASSSSSSGSSNSGGEADHSNSNASLTEVFGRLSVPRLTFRNECSPGRFLLMLVWCLYSVVIVGLAEAFLPYVILFTLFFFLVVLG
ncbi:uncharacterized protein LOC101863785 [Aplysia californica]|uniref:Uncharacterized protein LOC101863785 n=1 Tax=Aplysia californica TaxID=6500 RepID=A0ABM0ZVR3_APLCA|nr:uncharacterized protein LOC101863785 [Aplysia californica]